MSVNSNKRKAQQLGMPPGTAANKLRKMILFQLLQQDDKNVCFQCGEIIETVDELSIEHKVPWLGNDTQLYWDMSNIGFSHNSCNSSARRDKEPVEIHGTLRRYMVYGCRCEECKTAKREENKRNRK